MPLVQLGSRIPFFLIASHQGKVASEATAFDSIWPGVSHPIRLQYFLISNITGKSKEKP